MITKSSLLKACTYSATGEAGGRSPISHGSGASTNPSASARPMGEPARAASTAGIVNLDKRMMSPSLRATQASGHVRPSRASRQDEKDAATAPPELSGGAPHPVQPEQRGKLHPGGAGSQVLRRRAAPVRFARECRRFLPAK